MKIQITNAQKPNDELLNNFIENSIEKWRYLNLLHKIKKLRFLIYFFLVTVSFSPILGNGVTFVPDETAFILKLLESDVHVKIENQVAITKTTQKFHNNFQDSIQIKYAFPLPEKASATLLRYKLNGIWHKAIFSATPQDTTTPGGGGSTPNFTLIDYLGSNGLYYDIEQPVGFDSLITVELTYVELLEYELGDVLYTYPNDYSIIQNENIDYQQLSMQLNSERTISDVALLSHAADSFINSGNSVFLRYEAFEKKAKKDYDIKYTLSLNELGLYSLSTFLPDSVQKDSFGKGFFSFIVEPDPGESNDVIDKIFTLIIDRSGSMGGNKIVQARDAATFIVNNLNENDKFNIISFSSEISQFQMEHVDNTIENRNAALNYISSLNASGSTNISGAFDMAIPQFSHVDSTTANIIIFFTDGQQTAGIENTDELINHINTSISSQEKELSLFTFGIGNGTNERLLTTIANDNNGLADFLADNELESVISKFYLMIKNPVLLNTSISFSPDIINEIYPKELQNLYKGQQLILVGRFSNPLPLEITLNGNTFQNSVSYTYNIDLPDTANNNYQFLTKLWAKEKIEALMAAYYVNFNDETKSDSLKEEVIKLSLDYRVISPFTSFSGSEIDDGRGNDVVVEIEEYIFDDSENQNLENQYLTITSIGPNPCNKDLNITIETKAITTGNLMVKILSGNGVLVFNHVEVVKSNNTYSLVIDIESLQLPAGTYLIVLEFETEILVSKIVIG